MSIKNATQIIEQSDIEVVVRTFVPDLKKAGSGFKAKSPFVEEKTPSFNVSPEKQIYKCFSSGKGGNAANFLMEQQGMSFPEAVRWLADRFNILVEEDGQKPDTEKKERVAEMQDLLKRVQKMYAAELQKHPDVLDYLQSRGYTEKDIKHWGIGFVPDQWQFISTDLINQGLFSHGKELGLLGESKGRTYDTFRNRIMIPIMDDTGLKVLGFGGRLMGYEKKKSKEPKYMNTSDSDVYSKSFVLYGLNHAKKAIRDTGKAYWVEGYTDVHAMHRHGITNTVAGCGTSMTEGQMNNLKKHCKHVVLMMDQDKAGTNATEKRIMEFLSKGFRVEVCELPDEKDPDDYMRSISPASEKQVLKAV